MQIGFVSTRQTKILIVLILIVLTLSAYWQVQNLEFVNYDDQLYVTHNFKTRAGITWSNISYSFTDIRTSNWHPLTMMSHMLDWELFNDKAGGHHWTSLIIHILNTVLLFLFLSKSTGTIWRSALVSALFAVHPINVESVAWIAERKNVLSTFFWLLTMLFYIGYVKRPGWKTYLPVVICFALGLMSKPMLVTLPFVLLLIDYWPLNRTEIDTQNETVVQPFFKNRRDPLSFLLLEKIPLFVLTTISIIVTVYAARNASTIVHFNLIPMSQRINNAILSYALYLKQLFWPNDLTVLYLHADLQIIEILPAAFLLIVVTGICCRYYKQYPYLIFGWFWYLGTLVPVIGIVQVGSQSMADRYAYIPFIGMFISLSWVAADLVRNRLLKIIAVFFIVFVLIGLSVATHKQISYWKNSFTLFERALRVTNGNAIALIGMGNELIKQGKIDDAILYFQEAIKVNPKNPVNYVAFLSLGHALSLQKKDAEAIEAFRKSLAINPTCTEAYHKLGFVLFQSGRVDEAIAAYQKAIAFNSDYPTYHDSLGNAYIRQGKTEKAINEYKEVLRIQPDNAGAHNNLGMLFMQQGKVEQALEHYQEALRIQPLFANAHYRLSIILKQKGMNEKANYHYNEAIRINPEFERRKMNE